jgi:hypothetical protein
MNIDQPPITEVVVTPHALEELFATEDFPGVEGKLAKQPEFGTGAVDLFTTPPDHSRIRLDFDIPKGED